MRLTKNLILQSATLEGNIVVYHYLLDEMNMICNVNVAKDEIKKMHISYANETGLYKAYEKAKVKEKILIVRNETGQMAEEYITLRELRNNRSE